MVKQDHVPTAFFEHDLDATHHDPFGLHAFYSNPIGPNLHSRRAATGTADQYIHQEPKDDLFALRGEPLPAHLRPELVFSKTSTPLPASFFTNPAALLQQQKKDDAAAKSTATTSNTKAQNQSSFISIDEQFSIVPPSPTAVKRPLPASSTADDLVNEHTDDNTATPSTSAAPSTAPKVPAAKAPNGPKKRTRPVSACEGCRAKKVKCNLKPDLPICENCSAAGKTCLFRIDDLSPAFRAQRFGAYGPPGENARTIAGGAKSNDSTMENSVSSSNSAAAADKDAPAATAEKASRPADDIPGETASQRRQRRKRAREALLATGQRPPKAKAVFKSWANPSKLAAPCMPFTFRVPTSSGPMPAVSAAVAVSAAGMSMATAPIAFHTAETPMFSTASMINAAGVFHAGASSNAMAMPGLSPIATAMPISSWDSSSAAAGATTQGSFPQSFGSSLSSSLSSHHQHMTSLAHAISFGGGARGGSLDAAMARLASGSGAASFETGLGSPQGSIGSSFTSSYLDAMSVGGPHTPGLTESSGDHGLVMSPFSPAGASGLSPTATMKTTSTAAFGGAGAAPGNGSSGSGGNDMVLTPAAMHFDHAANGHGHGLLRPELHIRRHTTAGGEGLSMATHFGGMDSGMGTPMSIHTPFQQPAHAHLFSSGSNASFGGAPAPAAFPFPAGFGAEAGGFTPSMGGGMQKPIHHGDAFHHFHAQHHRQSTGAGAAAPGFMGTPTTTAAAGLMHTHSMHPSGPTGAAALGHGGGHAEPDPTAALFESLAQMHGLHPPPLSERGPGAQTTTSTSAAEMNSGGGGGGHAAAAAAFLADFGALGGGGGGGGGVPVNLGNVVSAAEGQSSAAADGGASANAGGDVMMGLGMGMTLTAEDFMGFEMTLV
ncbi:hypothetical protein V8E36_009266 [Tilletia maclaganii]